MRIRPLLPTLAAIAAIGLLAGCSTGSAAPAGDTAWSYTDGSGKTVELDAVPERIVAHAWAAAALIPLGIRPVAIYADGPVAEDKSLEGLDLTGIEIVGETWGEIDIEQVAELQPDLIVGEWWPVEEAYSGFEADVAEASAPLLEIAPVIGVKQGDSVETMIADYEELAADLGADLDAPSIVAAKDRFQESLGAFQAALAAKPDLTVLAVSPGDELSVAVPSAAAELADFQRWGMKLVEPAHPDEGFEYWETLSWENADTYQADLVIVDDRFPELFGSVEAQPTWQTITAVPAGAVADWPAFWLRNHDAYATALDKLTTAIDAADEHLVP